MGRLRTRADGPARMGEDPFNLPDPEFVERVIAEVAPERRARLTVPQMPPLFGGGCDWWCLPDSIEPECTVHAGYREVTP